MREEVSCLAGAVQGVHSDTLVNHFSCLVVCSAVDLLLVAACGDDREVWFTEVIVRTHRHSLIDLEQNDRLRDVSQVFAFGFIGDRSPLLHLGAPILENYLIIDVSGLKVVRFFPLKDCLIAHCRVDLENFFRPVNPLNRKWLVDSNANFFCTRASQLGSLRRDCDKGTT